MYKTWRTGIYWINLLLTILSYKGVRAPHALDKWTWGIARVHCSVKDREKEGLPIMVVAERWDILYVLVVKLTKETRRRVSRWRDYRWRDRRWRDWRGRAWIYFSYFSLLKPNIRKMYATCSCSIELYKQWYTYLGRFFAKLEFSRGFLYLSLTSGFWLRVRARALRAPVFLGS